MSGGGRKTAVSAGAGAIALAALGGEQYISNIGSRILPSFEATTASVSSVTASEIFAGTAATRIAPFAESRTISSGIGTRFSGGTVVSSYPNAPTSAKAWTPPINSQSNQLAKLQPFPKAVDPPIPAYGQISPPKPLMVSGLVFQPYQSIRPSAAANFISRVEPKIVDDLASLHWPISPTYANSVVYNDLRFAAQQAEKEPAASVSFEVLTGKIKIEASQTVAGVKVSGGEVNVYKVSVIIAAAAVTCNAVADSQFKDCVTDVTKKAIKKWLDAPKETETAGVK